MRHAVLDKGLMEGLPPWELKAGFTPDAWNVEFTATGDIRFPRPGSVRFSTSALSDGIDGMWHFTRPDGSWSIVVAAGTALYGLDASGEWTTLASGLTAGDWMGAVYNGKLFLTSTANAIKIYDTEVENLEDQEDVEFPPEWTDSNRPSRVSVVRAGQAEYLCLYGLPDDPSMAYFPPAGDYLDYDWTDLGSTAFRTAAADGDGEQLRMVAGYEDMMLLMKETKTVIYKDWDITTAIWPHKVIPFGCPGARSLVEYENGLAWWSQHGPIPFRAVMDYGEIAGDVVTPRIVESLKNVDPNRLDQIVGYYDDELNRLRWIAPDRTSVENNLIFDFHPQRRHNDGQSKQGAWLVGDGHPFSHVITMKNAGGTLVFGGDYDGWVDRLQFGVQDLGSDVTCRYAFPEFLAPRFFQFADFMFTVPAGGENLTCGIIWDDTDEVTLGGTLDPNYDTDGIHTQLTPLGGGRRARVTVHRTSGDDSATLSALDMEVG